MPTYTLPSRNWEHTKRLLAKILPLIALIAIGPFAMVYALSPTSEIFLYSMALFVLVCAIGIGLGVFTSGRQKFVFENDRITHRRAFGYELTLSKNEVSAITEDSDSGLTIRDATSGNTIFVPTDLIGYNELRTQLNAWLPIEAPPRTHSRALPILISMIAVSSLAAIGAFIFRIKFLFFVFAISFFAVLVYGFVISNKEKSPRKEQTPMLNRIVLALVVLYFLYEIIKSLIK